MQQEPDTKVNPDYKKGFEHGYWLQRGNSPALNQHTQNSAQHKEYASGLKAGSKEASREQVKGRMDKSKGKDKGIDIG